MHVVDPGESVTGNGGTLIRNSFTGGATMPSSDAILVDNEGVPRAPPRVAPATRVL